ncbi:MAG: hypothetical protein JSW25_03525 [Thermoplasmata archaeon]|nr:MAG: hypothetical protein JSW25_03525 [Thermoplasmata archaeon]
MEMQYRVHRMKVDKDNMLEDLERFINALSGEVISVFPNVTPTFKPMGATAKVDYLMIVEKLR